MAETPEKRTLVEVDESELRELHRPRERRFALLQSKPGEPLFRVLGTFFDREIAEGALADLREKTPPSEGLCVVEAYFFDIPKGFWAPEEEALLRWPEPARPRA